MATYTLRLAIGERRVAPPGNPLARRQLPWALSFEKQDAFLKSIFIVISGSQGEQVILKTSFPFDTDEETEHQQGQSTQDNSTIPHTTKNTKKLK